ncbi:MAG: triose-phosphate isomerase [Deltaproteobacteria bacterium]|nr:triose-phosphate isomerase [Deltaproteobacteria bacterium]
MLRPLIAGNWKMNTNIHQGVELVIRLRELLKGVDAVEVLLAPPFTSIYHLSHLVADSPIRLCGQNLFWEKSGAFTGEISGDMLKTAGCDYVIIGHSERREYFKESDETVNKKVVAAIRDGLKPIICVGETLEEREKGKSISKVKLQVKKALAGLPGGALRDITLAYEPIWAIGTGKTASPEEAEEVHNALRELLFEMFDTDSLKNTRIIYGGSVKADNIDSLMSQPNIDGALVGGASLKAEDFARIVKFLPR